MAIELIYLFVIFTLQVNVWVVNFLPPNSQCRGDSPFILRYDNDTCTPSQGCITYPMLGYANVVCDEPPLGNYARVKKYRDDVPGDCATYWSDGFCLLDSCQNFTAAGLGYLMLHCDGKDLVQTSYATQYCIKPQKELSHYIQDTCVVDAFGDNDIFVKFGRCGV